MRRLIELSLYPFDALPEALALTLLAVITGVVLLLLVRTTTPQRFVDRARNRMTSAVYETRLFLNDPGRLIKAQGRLVVWSFVYVAAMLPAFVLAAVPMGLYYLHLEGRYGKAPVALGAPLVLRVDYAEGRAPADLALNLPQGVRLTAGPVGVPHLARVYFRLEVQRPGVYDLQLRAGGETLSKRLVAARGTPVSDTRGRGFAALFEQSLEPSLPAGAIEKLSLIHPDRTDTWLRMPWWMYWMVGATVAALALRKPLGVAL